MKDTYTQYKKALEDELATLTQELRDLGVTDAEHPGEWVLKPSDLDIMESDSNEIADRAEEAHIDADILEKLMQRYASVIQAIERIEKGTYGTCDVCGKDIESDRLQANPAARTCKEHIDL